MSLNWGSMHVTEDKHGEIHSISIPYDPILELSEDYEHEGKRTKQDDVAIFLTCSFAVLTIITALAWLAWQLLPWAWANLVWLWNAGPDYLHFARWGIVAGVACMIWFCVVGLGEWWAKDKP